MVDPASIIGLLLAAGETGARLTGAAQRWLQGGEVDRILDRLDTVFGDETGLSGVGLEAWRSDERFMSALFAVSQTADWETYRDELLAAVVGLVAQDPDAPSDQDRDLAFGVVAEVETWIVYAKRGDQLSRYLANRGEAALGRTRQALEDSLEMLPKRVASYDASEQAGIGGLLIRGPLDQANVRHLVERAQAISEEQPRQAAQLMIRAAERLEKNNAAPLADTYRVRAAELLGDDGDAELVRRLFERTSREQLSRASSWASLTLSSYRRRSQPEERWRVGALEANLEWLGAPEAAREAAVEALTRSEGDAQWLADAIDVLVLLEDWHEVARLTDQPLEGEAWALKARFMSARSEALMSLNDESAEDYWAELAVELREAGVEERAVAWQRRAMRLALMDRPEEAREAYREAMEYWAEARGYEDEIGSCFYSSLNVALNMGISTSETELMPLASELRGAGMSSSARAEQREALGMRQRLGGRLRDAFFSYGEAMRIYRLSGNLMGVLGVQERLGELLGEAGRAEEATALYLAAGKTKEALRTASDLSRDELERVTAPTGPAWQRAAQYRVLARYGSTVSEDFVAEHLETLLSDAGSPRAEWFGPDIRTAAQLALAGVFLQVEQSSRATVATGIENELRTGMPEGRQRAGRALVEATEAGIWDSTKVAVEAFLREPQLSGVDLGWVAEQAERSDEVMNMLEEAALNGSSAALEAIACSGPDPVPPQLAAQATEQIGGLKDLKTVDRADGQVKVGFRVNRERLGLIALLTSTELRNRLAAHLIAAATDGEEPEMNRASAMRALFNLAVDVSRETALKIAEAVRPLARGAYEASAWDDEDDPLSAFRLRSHTPNSLRAAAVTTLARVGARDDVEDPEAPGLVEEALEEEDPLLLEAGLEAASLLNLNAPQRLTRFLAHAEPSVRQAALSLAVERGRLTQSQASDALKDPSPRVRQVLLGVDRPSELRSAMRDAMAGDPHAYLRALASR